MQKKLNQIADDLKYSFPSNLPISAKVDEIKKLWSKHQVIIIGGATGSGKTTQLPKIALEINRGRNGKIGCTQPRRLAATAMARRVSQELNVNCGEAVGYQVRFDDHTTKDTVIKFMTDGILLAETTNDRNLYQYDTIIIDEAHERSLNIDFLLGYIKKLIKVRPDLKIAISSATLDLQQFSTFFDNAPIVEVEGKVFPVENLFLPPVDNDEELEDHVLRAIKFISDLDSRGDILIFLPGEREINDCLKSINQANFRNTEILPLYARLSGGEQQKVFQTSHLRRIILATNVAETSLTIPGIKFCIDSGLARISRYNPRSRVQELRIERISQASIRQRSGRCGRTSDGICVHLYSEEELQKAVEYTDPEIHRTALAGVILKMLSLHLVNIETFPFIDPPIKSRIHEGIKTLEDLLAVKANGKKITPTGLKLAILPIDPHLGKMLITASQLKVLPEIIVLVSFLSIQDPKERPLEKQALADSIHRRYNDEKSDFLGILKLWNTICQNVGEQKSNNLLRKFAKQNFLNYNRLKEWKNLVSDLIDYSIEFNWLTTLPDTWIFDNPPYEQIHLAILAGIPRQVAKYDMENQIYQGGQSRKFTLFPGSALFKRKKPAPWVMSFAIVETSRLFGRMNAEILPTYVEKIAPQVCKNIYERPVYDANSGFVYAQKRVISGGLTLEANTRVHFGKINPAAAREIFIREALVNGEIKLPNTFIAKHYQKLNSLKNLELKLRRTGTIIDDDAIFNHFNQVLPSDIFSLENLKKLTQNSKIDYSMARSEMMQEQYNTFIESDYPDYLTFSGENFRLNYKYNPGEAEDGIFLLVTEDKLNLLPPWALDYLVIGFLAEKVELMFKSLPKNMRQQISPLAERARIFVEQIRNGELFCDTRLANVLCEFLKAECGVEVFVRDFENLRLPEFLKMKLLILSESNQAIEIYEEMPQQATFSSKLSSNIDILSQFHTTGNSIWPPNLPLPEEFELPNATNKTAYIALLDEVDTIGSSAFLNLHEAKINHTKGVLRLFKLRNNEQIKFIKRTTKLPREVLLSFFTNDSNKNYLDDLLDSLIIEALGHNLWDIRSESQFVQAEKVATQNLGVAADSVVSELTKIHTQYEKLYNFLKVVRMRLHDDLSDITWQLKFLFQTGFLRRPALWSHYQRFLRAAQIRAERLNANLSKDEQKLDIIRPYVEKFQLAVSKVDNIVDSPELYEFWLLLEESRIAVFSPEVGIREKNVLKKLADNWKTLHF